MKRKRKKIPPPAIPIYGPRSSRGCYIVHGLIDRRWGDEEKDDDAPEHVGYVSPGGHFLPLGAPPVVETPRAPRMARRP
jgi:hypothetical protein